MIFGLTQTHLAQEIERPNYPTLPTLEVLIDTALFNSPRYQQKLIEIEQQGIIVRIQKRSWLDVFTLSSKYNIGTNNLDGNITQPFSNTPTQWYGAGATLTIPLSDLANRNSQITLLELELDKTKEELESLELEITQRVIRAFQDTKKHQELIEIRYDALSMSNVNLVSAKIAYQQNTISIEEYSRIIDINTKANVALQESIAEYTYSIKLLELISGIKLA